MPTLLKIEAISTLKLFSNFIEQQLIKSSDNILWFRGAGRKSYTLTPTLHRHPNTTAPDKIIDLEKNIIDRFNQRSIPFLLKPFNKQDDWEILFFMQHYRIPTRLLDWTESPFVALYFALSSAAYKIISKKRVYSEDAAIWVLDPVLWNKESLKDYSFDAGILSIEDAFINSFKPRTMFGNIRDNPVCIYGTHNNSRIVSQRGVFTIAGKKIKPIESIYTEDNFPQDCLIKLVIPKSKIESLLISLISIGVTDSVVYPDLEGFAMELKRFFKFEM